MHHLGNSNSNLCINVPFLGASPWCPPVSSFLSHLLLGKHGHSLAGISSIDPFGYGPIIHCFPALLDHRLPSLAGSSSSLILRGREEIVKASQSVPIMIWRLLNGGAKWYHRSIRNMAPPPQRTIVPTQPDGWGAKGPPTHPGRGGGVGGNSSWQAQQWPRGEVGGMKVGGRSILELFSLI